MATKTTKPLDWTTEKRKIKDLVPYNYNPRKLSEDKKALLIKSIEKFNLAEIPAINTDNKIIADTFLGSGSTMVASEQLNRKCYGMELDPKYCQVIVDRMHKLNPLLTITRNGKPYKPTNG